MQFSVLIWCTLYSPALFVAHSLCDQFCPKQSVFYAASYPARYMEIGEKIQTCIFILTDVFIKVTRFFALLRHLDSIHRFLFFDKLASLFWYLSSRTSSSILCSSFGIQKLFHEVSEPFSYCWRFSLILT